MKRRNSYFKLTQDGKTAILLFKSKGDVIDKILIGDAKKMASENNLQFEYIVKDEEEMHLVVLTGSKEDIKKAYTYYNEK